MTPLRAVTFIFLTIAILSGCASSGTTASSIAQTTSLSAAQSKAVYEKFKGLEGEWDTRSTKGWGGRISYHVITGGACVMQMDDVAHPGEMMVTMVHPDGNRLLLTHYCAAKNQPRLVATMASADLSEVTFTFLDGTNLRSRDQGHMDKVVFRFKGSEEFTDRWTWYQDGKESWMEDITNVRVPHS